MRHGRWIALAAGLAAALALVAPAGARVKAAPSDKALLQAGVMTAADVPSTWTAKKQADTGSKGYKGIVDCKQIVAAINAGRRGPNAHSPEFFDPTSTSNALAQDSVFVFKNVKAATQYLSTFQATNASSCLKQALTKATGGKGQVTVEGHRFVVAPITDLPVGIGDDQVGYEASITGTSQSGQPVHIVVDLVGMRIGRTIVEFDFLNNDTQLQPAPTIVTGVVSRVRTLTNH
jgi:hypothetical protein